MCTLNIFIKVIDIGHLYKLAGMNLKFLQIYEFAGCLAFVLMLNNFQSFCGTMLLSGGLYMRDM